VNNNNNKIP